jgi:hypothetical protein
MNKVEEIFKAWRIAFNPNHEQAELAANRIEICNSCEFKETLTIAGLGLITKCSVCGCALKGKIFTPLTYKDGGSCPEGKWNDVEDEWIIKMGNVKKVNENIKNGDTLILKDNTEHYETYDGFWSKYIILPKIGNKITIKCGSTFNFTIKVDNTNLPDQMILKKGDVVNFVFEDDKWIWQN